MSNALYDRGRNKFLVGGIDWLNDTIGAILVDAALYTKDLSTHEYLSDVPAGARVALATLTNTATPNNNGVADADDVVFSSVSGATVEQIILYKNTGLEGTSALIANYDTATGLPVTPNGGDITVTWQATDPRIFKL
jgi:hypothetical protein